MGYNEAKPKQHQVCTFSGYINTTVSVIFFPLFLALTVCTTGSISAVTIADESFPVGYDATQFDLCLKNTVLQDNLAAIIEKVVDTSFQAVILNKLNQVSYTDHLLSL